MQEPYEKLIRLRAPRRESTVDLRVHYEVSHRDGCDTIRIISIDEMDQGTITIDLTRKSL